MARNTPLGVVRSAVISEAHKALGTNATQPNAEVNQIIADVQFYLAATYDWPFLHSRWDVFVPPGQRYTNFPTVNGNGLTCSPNLERPTDVKIKWNNIWIPVVYGIDEEPEFNYLDSDRNQVLDPIQRWQFNDEGQFENWPLPATNSQIRFIGQRTLTTLQTGATNPPTWNDSATCDLDDLLITYFAAAEYLIKEDSKKAEYELGKAQKRLLAIRGSYPVREQTTCIGRGPDYGRKTIRLVPLVVVGGH